jgi:hypothetical protein
MAVAKKNDETPASATDAHRQLTAATAGKIAARIRPQLCPA